MKYKDISGQKFGRLTALYKLHNTKGRTKWLCVCECGNLSEVRYDQLKSGKTKSCGCLHKDTLIKQRTKHNKCDTRLYSIWECVIQRCCNNNYTYYKNYGGRGIAVCSEWRNDFMSFYNWAVANGYKEFLTLDRIDNDSNYEPSNCRWITMKQQARNRRSNRNYTINGEKHCLSEWCEILGLNYKRVGSRLRRNWSIERALELNERGDTD